MLEDPNHLLKELDRAECEESLLGYIQRSWEIVEPNAPFINGWHIKAICEHLEAITYGYINRLLINVPPGTMKSLAAGVFWPTWEWGPANRPSTRVVATSHSINLAIRDNLRSRRLVQSQWYQDLWGDKVKLTSDQNSKTKYENSATGFRDAMAFTSLTGSRGDRVIIDDPLSVDNARSEAERNNVNITFLESVPTRMNDPKKSAIVVIMQRLHEEDPSGIILSRELGYEHLMLPMEFEPERRCVTSIGFSDPRTEEGELLFPARFPRDVVERDKIPMGPFGVAGQFQQRPVPREGGMFKLSWFSNSFVNEPPAGTRWIRHWDLAATSGSRAARTAGVKVGRAPDGRYFVGDVRLMQSEAADVRKTILTTAIMDGKLTEISIPQDPGQAGKDQGQSLVMMLAGFIARARKETGDKVVRAEPFSAQCEAGNVYLVRGDWNKVYLEELCMFPNGKFKDQVDASANAFNILAERAQPMRISDSLLSKVATMPRR